MKKLLLTTLLSAAFYEPSYAGTIWTETFETDGQGTRYTSDTELLASAEDYYGRFSNNTTDRSYTNVQGTNWWGGQDQDAVGDGLADRTITFSNINISSYTDLVLKGLFAEERPEANGQDDIDSADYIHVQYQIDGSGWQNLLWFESTNSLNSPFQIDTNFDGTGDGPEQLETAFSDFSANITGTGSSLDMRVITKVNSGDEDWAMDNLRVEGTPFNSAPVLEVGDQAVVVSNELSFTVTAADIDGDDIVLSATNLPAGAVFNTVTNATVITNTFTWTTAAPTGTYSVTFYANDGTNNASKEIAIRVIPPSVTFDFAGDTDPNLYPVLDGESGPISYTNQGLAATFTASTGTMNRTTGGFGIDTSVSGEDADKFDIGEWIDIVFDIPVILTNINVSNWSTMYGDEATIFVNGTSNGVINSTGDHSFDITVSSGEILRIAGTGGAITNNGWSLNSITVRTITNLPPVLSPIGNQFAAAGDSLNFTVIATDADGNDIILSATNLPAGATFSTVTNASPATNTFTWAGTTAGVYNVTFTADDSVAVDSETITITVTNPPPVSAWTVYYNLPYQSSSGSAYPDQFVIRDALVDRIDALESGDSAILAAYTFSAAEGAGAILTAMDEALDRGASISFIADAGINVGADYGADYSLFNLVFHPVTSLDLVIDGSNSGIMHNKLGLFDYGGSNQWVFTASWNFTEAASANQWNIALEACSPSLYAVYTNETTELLEGRFHGDPTKSHAHDGSTFMLDGSWGTNFARFSPPPTSPSVEDDITNLIAQAQSEIVFSLNKLTRIPIRDALIDAANRGVIIKGVMPRSDTEGDSAAIYSYLTNSANYSTANIVQFLPAVAKADYSALDSGEQNLIHTKYMVIDPQSANAVVIHGSANWTANALVDSSDNDENTLFLRHNGIAAEFNAHFQRVTGTGSYSGGNTNLVWWNFADTNRIADGGIPVNLTSTIVRDSSQTNYTYTGGALSSTGWDDGIGTKYWETQFSTTNYTDIKVSSRQLASSTGPADFKLQYKIGVAGSYSDVPGGTVHVPDGGNGLLTRVLLPEACNNQATVFLRWLLTSDTSVSGGTIGAIGAGRIDDIVVVGTADEQSVTIDPPIIILTIDGTQPTMYWEAAEGLRYIVLWTPSLLEEFHPLATNDWPIDNWTDTALNTNTASFYKLDVEPIE